MESFQILDTSLRDGGYQTNFHFSDEELEHILLALDQSGIEFYEGLAGQFRGSTHHQLHWTLDMTFTEDESRIRTEASPENFAIIRHIALNLIKNDTS